MSCIRTIIHFTKLSRQLVEELLNPLLKYLVKGPSNIISSCKRIYTEIFHFCFTKGPYSCANQK